MKILCFDIGGTSIKYSLIEDIENYDVLETKTRKTKENNYILQDVLKIIEKHKDIDAIGISTAGVVDSDKGEVIFAGPTIPGYTGTKFKEIIAEKYGLPCIVENDVNSAAYGEYIFSKVDGMIFCLTLGTGIGGSIIYNGELIKGNSMTAGEIGYMPFKNNYFQNYASTSFLVKKASKKLERNVDGYTIFEEAKKGNQICLDVIDEMVNNLSKGLLNIIYLLNPKVIIIGGAITKQGDYLKNKIVSTIDEKIINGNFKTNIEFAKLENNAGIYGIYHKVLNELKKEG